MSKGNSGVIDTSRFNDVVAINSLNPEQKAAVYRLRRFSNGQKVSPYTLGVLTLRDLSKLEKLSDGKRFARLSPASREILIAEAREAVYPFEPTVVAVWSAWAVQNNVLCHPSQPTVGEPMVYAEPVKPIDTRPNEPNSRGYRVGVSKRIFDHVKATLADGKEHEYCDIYAGLGFEATTAQMFNAVVSLPIQRRRAYNFETGKRTSWWMLTDVKAEVKPVFKRNRSTEESISILRDLLLDGPKTIAWLEERFPLGRTMLYATASKIGVERSGGHGQRTWKLSDLPITSHAVEGVVVGFDGTTHQNVIRGVRDQDDEKLALLKDRAARRLIRLATREHVSTSTLARWTEMIQAVNGTPYGARLMPERESDEGIELADEVFRACLPLAPQTASDRALRLLKEKRRARETAWINA